MPLSSAKPIIRKQILKLQIIKKVQKFHKKKFFGKLIQYVIDFNQKPHIKPPRIQFFVYKPILNKPQNVF